MLPIALALVAASFWGFSAVLVRMGLRDISTAAGTLVSLVAGLIFTAALVVALQWSELTGASRTAFLLFGLIGILNFPIGRFFNYLAMSHLGVSRSTPILASAPLFAVIIAVLFTGESLGPATAAGIALIVSGLLVTVTARAR